MLKNFYQQISVKELCEFDDESLKQAFTDISELGLKKIDAHSDVALFLSGDEITQTTYFIVLNLNIYNIGEKNFILNTIYYKNLINLIKSLGHVNNRLPYNCALIICRNPKVLEKYLIKKGIRIPENAKILHLQPTNLFVSLLQKEIHYYVIEQYLGEEKNAMHRLKKIIVENNIRLNQKNKYITPYVSEEKLYNFFIAGGPLVKLFIAKNTSIYNHSVTSLIQLELPPLIHKNMLITGLKEDMEEAGFALKNLFTFNEYRIQPSNIFYMLIGEEYRKIFGEYPYIEWSVTPSAAETFAELYAAKNQIIFGPGILNGNSSEAGYMEQFSVFIKLLKSILNSKGDSYNGKI